MNEENKDINQNEEYSTIFDAPTKKETKEEEIAKNGGKKKMPKQTMFIIISLIVCVALVAGIFAVIKFISVPDNSSKTLSTTSDNVIYDYSSYLNSSDDTEYLNIGGITSVTIQNRLCTFTTEPVPVVSTETDVTTGELTTSESLAWRITSAPGYNLEGVNISDTMVKYDVTDALKMAYFEIYADDVNATIPSGEMTYFQECGFDDPECKVDISFADGSALTLNIGDKTPTGDGYFIYVEGKPNMSTQETVTADGETIPILGRPNVDTHVYKSSSDSVSFLLSGIETLVEHQIVPQFSNSDDTSATAGYYMSGTLISFDSIELYTQAIGKTYNFSCVDTADTPAASNIYFVNAPENFTPSTDRVDELLSPLSDGLRCNICYELRATNENMKTYGLDNPIAKVRYVVGEDKVGITIGKGVDADYYAVMIDGDVSIYKVAAVNLAFVETTPENWRNKTLYAGNIVTVSEMKMEVKDENGNVVTTDFHLEHLDTEGNEENLIVTTSDGRTIDSDKFRTMYEAVISTSIEGEYDTNGSESSSPQIKITVHYVGYDKTDVLKYSDYSARRYYFTVNGKNGAPVLSTLVEKISNAYFDAIAQ